MKLKCLDGCLSVRICPAGRSENGAFRVLLPNRGFPNHVIRGSNDEVIIDVLEKRSGSFYRGVGLGKISSSLIGLIRVMGCEEMAPVNLDDCHLVNHTWTRTIRSIRHLGRLSS